MSSLYSSTDFVNSKRTESTKKMVKYCLSSYLTFINNGVKIDDMETYSLSYVSSEREFFNDVIRYVDFLLSSGRAPKTISNYIFFIRLWLRWNNIIFNPVQESILTNKMPRSVAIHDEDYLNPSKLTSILSHSDILLKTIILFLASSGMRVGECLLIEYSQIRGNEIHMSASQMKAAKPHVYFVSKEALNSLLEWNKIKAKYLLLADARRTKCLNYSDGSGYRSEVVFPISYQTINTKFSNA
ncbi:MAG: hypothetical protein Q4Q53_07640, partial [Methanocorpusculum sp.]|nr:hypothetical protein [Methanocorpusculum sp.]